MKTIKKILLWLTIFWVGMSSSFADWSLDNAGTILTDSYVSTALVNECTNIPTWVWFQVWDLWVQVWTDVLSTSDLDLYCWANPVPSTWSMFLSNSWVLNVVSDKISSKVPTAFSWTFGDYIADLLVLWLIILWIIIFKRVTWVSKNS